jgi:hypothetical protein
MESGTIFRETPVWKPGAIWKVSGIDGMRPLIEHPGAMPDLPSLMVAISAKLRNLLNSEDISQGFQASQYEKATATSLRATGAAKRQMPTNKQYGMVLNEVARMILALNQQFHPEAHRFVLDVVIDVPSLTNVSDPDNEKQEALLLLTEAMNLPFYASPTGRLKLLNLWEDVLRKFKKSDIEKFAPNAEELQSDMAAEREVALAQIEKRAAQENLAVMQSGG